MIRPDSDQKIRNVDTHPRAIGNNIPLMVFISGEVPNPSVTR